MDTCATCGEELPQAARFCPACGMPVSEAPGAVSEERKVISVLFADLVGFTAHGERLDPEDLRATLGAYHARLRAELERYGGTVEKFIGDAVMALFGAPVSHEDDPERAVRAALAIRDAVTELEAERGLRLGVRIAVNTGEAVVAIGARPAAGEGMAAGDVLNTASRLEKAAPRNGVLVGETTFRATRHRIVYREVDAVHAKGKTEPIRAWEALSVRGPVGEAPSAPGAPLVGRAKELSFLLDAYERTQEGTAQLVTLVGVPGIGKSRLVIELCAEVEKRPEPALWRQGRCLPYGEGVTYWALAEMVRSHAGILRSDGAAAAQRKLRQAVRQALADEAEAEWAEGHLRPLIGVSTQAELGSNRRGEAFAAWRRYLEVLASDRPLVLVFEDLHWADEGLLDFVDQLVEFSEDVPLLAICTARPNLFERRPDWGGGQRNAATISLGPLSDDETARLVSGLLEQAVLPLEAQSALVGRAEGNPLYAEEYIRMLMERGYLRRERATWLLDEGVELPLPESVQAIIAARIDALRPEEKALIQDAAVVGKTFWVGAVEALGDAPMPEIETGLHALELKDFLRRERRSSVAGEVEFSFRHALVREVAYGQIPRARRSEKHALAAAWIESLAAGREDHAEMRAHHYLDALEYARASGTGTQALDERARTALRDAGDRAAALSAFGRAVNFYEPALELWPEEDPERPRLLYMLGKALFHARARGGELLAEARDGLLSLEDPETAAEADVLLAEQEFMQGHRDAAHGHLRRAADLLEQRPASRSKAYVLSSLSRFLAAGDDLERALPVAREALRMAEALGAEELRASALATIGSARVMSGDWSGLIELERSIAIAEELNSPEALRGYLNLGTMLAHAGDLRRAFEVHGAGRGVAERFGDAMALQWFAGEHVYQLYWQGRWDEALELAERLLSELDAGSRVVELDAGLVRGWIRLARSPTPATLEDAAGVLAFAREAKDPQMLFPALAFAGRAQLAVGARAAAEAAADELLAAWTPRQRVTIPSFWTTDLALLLRGLRRGEELAERAPTVQPQTRWLDAAAALAIGRDAEAAARYAGIGARPEEAHARLLAAEENETHDGLESTLAFFRRVGASAYVARGERLLAAS